MATPLFDPNINSTMGADPSGWVPIKIIDEHTDYDIPESHQEKVVRGNGEGYECIGCGGFFPQAELNWPEDALTYRKFKCYCCRKGLSHR